MNDVTEVVPRASKRPDEICDEIKNWIVKRALKPGDRLPQERELMDLFKASKSTVREAMRVLQTQGLISTRTGPGGGAFVAALDSTRAMELLSNHFFFNQPTLSDIYALRKILEPEMVAGLAGKLTDKNFERLHATISLYDHTPENLGEEYAQRLAELKFHSVLAEVSENPILGFICRFLQNLLRNLAICRRIYDKPNPELREKGLHYQVQLLKALKSGDSDLSREIMYKHMCAAQEYMEACETEMTTGFLKLNDPGAM